MKSDVCRWGILGTANIARKNWQAIRFAPNCTLTTVASRQIDRSRQFVAECQSHAPFPQPPRCLGSYEELLRSDDVDAVYIPLPTVVRKAWAVEAAKAGKHILVEKPVGATESDVREIVSACEANRVQFMDGVMFMHSERLQQLRSVLDDEVSIGSVERITSEFTFGATPQFFAENIRATSDLEPLGCLGDLGWYNIRFALWVMRWSMPLRVRGQILAARQRPGSPEPVPVDFSAELAFPGASASFYCSFITQIQQWASIAGPTGSLHISDFVLPWHGSELAWELSQPVFYLRGCDFHMERHVRRSAVREHSNSDPSAQESRMFTHFAELVKRGTPDAFWADIAIKTQRVTDACLASAHQDGQLVDVAS
jgi:predicted dehydrogenase